MTRARSIFARGDERPWQATWVRTGRDTAGPVPPVVPLGAAGALPGPALTADQTLTDALQIQAGQTVLVHGAGGVTGGMLVQLAVHAVGQRPHLIGPVRLAIVEDGHSAQREEAISTVRARGSDNRGALGADAAANAARSGARHAVWAIRHRGRLATITADPPPAERGISVFDVQVVPDGARLRRLTRLLGQGAISVTVGARYPLGQAAR